MNSALEYKQRCADRLQFFVHEQAEVLAEIQRLDYVPTPDLKTRLDSVVAAYAQAVSDFEAASAVCDEPVQVKVRPRR
jgi:hypothetical protein